MSVEMRKGTSYSILSALVFGLTPILVSLSYALGSDALTLTFYRNLMAIPVLLIVLLVRKIDLRINFRELMVTGLVALFNLITMLILYDAYNYIGVGLATTLHFLYPICTVVLCRIFFQKRLDKAKIIALFLATAGIVIATGESQAFAMKGIFLAVVSAATYAVYMIGIEQTAVKSIDSMKAMFYMCIVSSAVVFLWDLPSGNLVFDLGPKAMFYTFIVSIANSAVGHVMLIKGVKLIGAGNAAIFSMLEPVSGVVGGIIFLHEGMTVVKLISCMMILAAVMIHILKDRREEAVENNS